MHLLADENDLQDVRSEVASLAGKWKDLGISLGVRIGDLDEIISANPHSSRDCLREMLTKWLRQNYNVMTHPPSLIYYATLLSEELEKLPFFPREEVWGANLEKTGGSRKG